MHPQCGESEWFVYEMFIFAYVLLLREECNMLAALSKFKRLFFNCPAEQYTMQAHQWLWIEFFLVLLPCRLQPPSADNSFLSQYFNAMKHNRVCFICIKIDSFLIAIFLWFVYFDCRHLSSKCIACLYTEIGRIWALWIPLLCWINAKSARKLNASRYTLLRCQFLKSLKNNLCYLEGKDVYLTTNTNTFDDRQTYMPIYQSIWIQMCSEFDYWLYVELINNNQNINTALT